MSFGSVKALCIDLDGTLVNSHDYLYTVFQKFMSKRGVPDTREAFNALVGPSLKEVMDTLKQKYGWKEETDELLLDYRKNLKQITAEDIPLFPGVHEALKQFKAWGLKLAIVTSAYRKYADKILQMHDLAGYFDFVITPEDSGFISKPNGVIYQKAIQKFAILPNEALAVEDSFTGIKSALNAGIPVCYLTHGSPLPQDVVKEKIKIIKDWPALVDAFKESYD